MDQVSVCVCVCVHACVRACSLKFPSYVNGHLPTGQYDPTRKSVLIQQWFNVLMSTKQSVNQFHVLSIQKELKPLKVRVRGKMEDIKICTHFLHF